MLDIGIVDHVQAMHTDKLILGLCKIHRISLLLFFTQYFNILLLVGHVSLFWVRPIM